MRASDWIRELELIEHPEGGYFRETYRSGAPPMHSKGRTDPQGATIQSDREGGSRNRMTSIYWLVDRSSPIGFWCRNASDHVHYFHAGVGLRYFVIPPEGGLQTHRLGSKVTEGERPQLLVRGGSWKAALLEGEGAADYCLLGEGVAPGFDFRDLIWGEPEALREAHPRIFAENPHFFRFFRQKTEENTDKYYEND